MATSAQKIVGTLLLIFLATGIIYISFEDKVRIRVDNDKTTFYIKFLNEKGEPYGSWRVSGREYNKLFDGTKLIYRRAKDITIQTDINEEKQTVTIKRTTPYYNGAIIIDTYFFDGKMKETKLFPVFHTVEIINGNTCGSRGCIYQYEVSDLEYDGETREATSPEYFGKNMVVEWSSGNYYAKVFQQLITDKLIVKYRVKSNYEIFNVRLFDPPSPLLTAENLTFSTGTDFQNITREIVVPANAHFFTATFDLKGDIYSETDDTTPVLNLNLSSEITHQPSVYLWCWSGNPSATCQTALMSNVVYASSIPIGWTYDDFTGLRSIYDGLLKFNLSKMPSPLNTNVYNISSATLSLKNTGDPLQPAKITIYWIPDDSWQAMTTTYDNSPTGEASNIIDNYIMPDVGFREVENYEVGGELFTKDYKNNPNGQISFRMNNTNVTCHHSDAPQECDNGRYYYSNLNDYDSSCTVNDWSTSSCSMARLRYFDFDWAPRNAWLEIGVEDGEYEWEQSDYFNITNTSVGDFSDKINNYLDSCTPDAYGNCTIVFKWSVGNGGKGVIEYSNVQMEYLEIPGFEEGPEINSTEGTNLPVEDLNCYFTPIDSEDRSIEAIVTWFNSSIEIYIENNQTPVTNGSEYRFILDSGNTSEYETWSCQINMTFYDTSILKNSSDLIIKTPLQVELFLDGLEKDRKYEYGTFANITAYLNCSACKVCIGSTSPDLNESFICDSGSVNLSYLISDFQSVNFTTDVSENLTFAVANQIQIANISLIDNTTVNRLVFSLSGWDTLGNYPEDIICDIMNDSLTNLILPGNLTGQVSHIENFIGKDYEDNLLFTQAGTKILYLNYSEKSLRDGSIENVTINITGSKLNSEDFYLIFRFEDYSFLENQTGEAPYTTWEDFTEGEISGKWEGDGYSIISATPPYLNSRKQTYSTSCSTSSGSMYSNSKTLDIGTYGTVKIRYYLHAGGCVPSFCSCEQTCQGNGLTYLQIKDTTSGSITTIKNIVASAFNIRFHETASSDSSGLMWLKTNRTTQKIEFWDNSELDDINYVKIGEMNWDSTHNYEIRLYGTTSSFGFSSENNACGANGRVTGDTQGIFYFLNVSGFTGVKTANFTWTNGTIQSIQIANFSENLSSSTLTAETTTPGSGTDAPQAYYYLSSDNGTTWEQVFSGILHIFETAGQDLKFKIDVENTNLSDAKSKFDEHIIVKSVEINIQKGAPENISIDVGGDGSYEWSMNGSFYDNMSLIANWTGADVVSVFPSDCVESCQIPIAFSTDAGGVISFKQLDANTTWNSLDFTSILPGISNYTEKNSSIIPVVCSSNTANSILEFRNLDARYIDEKNISFTAEYDGSNITYLPSNQTFNIQVRYSPFTMNFPPYITQWEIRPKKLIQENITPLGQSYVFCNASINLDYCTNKSTPIFNFTNLAKIDSIDILIRLNETIDNCVNITLSNTTRKIDGMILNTTDQKYIRAIPLSGSGGSFMEVDINCNSTALSYLNPQIIWNSVCSDCVNPTDIEGD